MRARDVMTVTVARVEPDTSVHKAAALMLERGISGLPVIDGAGRLAGIVTEGDLLRRVEAGTDRRRSPWSEFVASSETLACEFVKAHGRRVADVMTPAVVTAAPDTPLAEIAALFERHRIKRVPVVEDGTVVGIVSRADLLRAVARETIDAPPASPFDDGSIRKAIVGRLWAQSWAHPSQINVTVQGGEVELWGQVASDTERKAVRVLAEETPGVRRVISHLALQSGAQVY